MAAFFEVAGELERYRLYVGLLHQRDIPDPCFIAGGMQTFSRLFQKESNDANYNHTSCLLVEHFLNMLRRPRQALVRCLQYVQTDLKEIVLPSSIPDEIANDPQGARLRARDILRVCSPRFAVLKLRGSCQCI